jgi:hypothetical protein
VSFSSAFTVHAKHAHKYIDESRTFFKIGKVFTEIRSEMRLSMSAVFVISPVANKINNGRHFIDEHYSSDFTAGLHGVEMLIVAGGADEAVLCIWRLHINLVEKTLNH